MMEERLFLREFWEWFLDSEKKPFDYVLDEMRAKRYWGIRYLEWFEPDRAKREELRQAALMNGYKACDVEGFGMLLIYW